MDLNYYSLTKLLIIYGLIGAIFSLITCYLSTYINCSDIFCKVKDEKNNNYYDNFKVYYYKFKSAKKDKKIYEILIKIIGCISFFFYKYFSLLVIKLLSPVFITFSFPLIYFSRKIFSVSFTLFYEGSFFTKEENKLIPNTKFFLDLSGDLISLLGFLIYLEIIVFNCCKLNYNTKLNIINRSLIDKFLLFENVDEDQDQDYLIETEYKDNFEEQEPKQKATELQIIEMNK
jgi:hypothetical protein